MARATSLINRLRPDAGLDKEAILNALGSAVVVVDAADEVVYVNGTAEQMLQVSAGYLKGKRLDSHVPEDSPIFPLIQQVRRYDSPVSEYDLTLESPRIGKHLVNVHAAPVNEVPGNVLVEMQERSIAEKIDRQLTHRGAARSVTAMAAMLAHEVKNPLSGIRGAAQLLEQGASEEDKALTQLIREESDRIVKLVNRMEVFSDRRPPERDAVNIHQVLDRVRQLAEAGFGRHVRFVNEFDPSLPPVYGNRDQLLQVFLNLVKNASEAVPEDGGEIVMSTAYQQGVRFAVPGTESRVHLPMVIKIRDNGPGIPEDIRAYMFDPFVTSKPNGSGLGLALVAKIIGDHGGVIECVSQPKRTEFRVMLPVYREADAREFEDDEPAQTRGRARETART